ncbi:MAG: hypothetical protein QOI95_3452 [Acidimicrobiaceae bacterium]|jgi:glycosyltransferase involved in cell wall biosynthesis
MRRAGELVVLHVLEAIEGGTARHLVDVVTHASGALHEVAIPASRSAGVTDEMAIDELQRLAHDVHFIPMRRSASPARNLRALLELRHLVARIEPDVVHGHSSVGGALSRVVGRGRPIFYTPNGIVTTRHHLVVERLLARATDRLIATSPSEGATAARLKLAPADRIVVIPNGIDVDARTEAARDLRAEWELGPQTPLVGTIARLVPQKAPDQFVRACAAVHRDRPDAHFVLIGSGPLQDVVDREVAAAGLTACFHQIAYTPAASSELGQFDVFVLLSRFEGGPYTPLESLRAGTPVVVTDVTGNSDAIEGGVTGRVVPFGDSRAAASAVIGFLEDGASARRMVAAGRESLRRQFDVREMGRTLSRLYAERAGVAPVER